MDLYTLRCWLVLFDSIDSFRGARAERIGLLVRVFDNEEADGCAYKSSPHFRFGSDGDWLHDGAKKGRTCDN